MPEAPAIEKPEVARPLDDIMLAMDVVDTLRHRASLVDRELHADERDQALIERLRSIYAAQGIEVPDQVLAEGVEALREDRFKYTPNDQGFQAGLARLYASRGRWGRPVLAVLGLLLAAGLAYGLLVALPRERRVRAVPRELTAQSQAIAALSATPEATLRARQLAEQGAAAVRDGRLDAARKSLEELKSLRSRLEAEYDLVIVSQGSTGVWRVPDVNSAARNYYIIVQAVTPEREVLTLPVTSEEDGKTRQVDKWGLRVDEPTFRQIAADKSDDGIIQNNRFGVKRRGRIEPEYLIDSTGGAITSW
jgi:hypothetical protein